MYIELEKINEATATYVASSSSLQSIDSQSKNISIKLSL